MTEPINYQPNRFPGEQIAGAGSLISKDKIRRWLTTRIIPLRPDPGYEFTKDFKDTHNKALEALTQILINISKKMPRGVNSLIQSNLRFVIIPQYMCEQKYSDIAGAGHDSKSNIIGIDENMFYSFYPADAAKMILEHEIYHALNFTAAGKTSRVAYSDKLNRRLNGEWDKILKREQKNITNFHAEVLPIFRKNPSLFLNKDPKTWAVINKLIAKHNIWIPFYCIKRDSKIQLTGLDGKMDGRELFAYSLEAFSHSPYKERMEKFNPRLHQIITKVTTEDFSAKQPSQSA